MLDILLRWARGRSFVRDLSDHDGRLVSRAAQIGGPTWPVSRSLPFRESLSSFPFVAAQKRHGFCSTLDAQYGVRYPFPLGPSETSREA